MATNDIVAAVVVGICIGIPFVAFIILTLSNFTVVRQKENVIVERWGRFHAKWGPGLHFLIPFMDKAKVVTWRQLQIKLHQTDAVVNKNFYRIDFRQATMDFRLQTIITRDNVEISVRPMVIYEFCDAMKVAYEVYDLSHAVEKLVQTTLRSIIGDMGLDDTLASREEINRGILQKISHVCYNWGIRICRVELLEIIPTASVQEAMHHQLSAERVRRAAIVTADGFREKVKTEAEGNSQAKIAMASGRQQCMVIQSKASADARYLIAKAEADALRIVNESLQSMNIDATQYMIAIRYMETLAMIAQKSTSCEMFMPFETDIIGSIANI